MNCPKCESTALKLGKIESKKLHLDRCPSCKGMWFGQGELSVLLGSKASEKFWVPVKSLKAKDSKCPRCCCSLYVFCYPSTTVLIDGCKQCEGVWLDNKEWQIISQQRDIKNDLYGTTAQSDEPSYADDIPGIKGKLLRMIDNSIKSLSGGFFK